MPMIQINIVLILWELCYLNMDCNRTLMLRLKIQLICPISIGMKCKNKCYSRIWNSGFFATFFVRLLLTERK